MYAIQEKERTFLEIICYIYILSTLHFAQPVGLWALL